MLCWFFVMLIKYIYIINIYIYIYIVGRPGEAGYVFLGTPIGCRDWVEQQLDREWRSSDRLREAVLDAELSAAVGGTRR